jgi:alkylhydroperoxidase family enzyme
MARVPYPKKEDLREQDRHIYERMLRERGGGHIRLALANHPKLLEGVMAMAGALRSETRFERNYRELGIVMVGLITKSDYEFDHHWNAALQAGVKHAQLESLAQFETSPHFNDQERAVLRYAKEVTETGVVADSTWSRLRGYFDIEQAMEVVLTVAWYNCVVRILLPLQIEHEPGFKRN